MPVLVVRIRPETFPFLQLPREIRDVIYEFVLVEPPRHQRRHQPTCIYPSLSPACAEKPPFCTEEGPAREARSCRCAKRRNLAVLSVSRQVHDEGGRVLWQENVFSFDATESFRQWLARVSAARRGLIRHLAIYLVMDWPRRFVADARGIVLDARLLRDLLSCPNLRTLDLGPARMPDGFVPALARQLPHLQSLRMAGLAPVAHAPSARRGLRPHDAIERTTVWGLVHVAVRLDDVRAAGPAPRDLGLRADPARWYARARAVGRQLEGRLHDGRWEGYCDTRNTARLRLPHEGQPVEVPLVGVPNGPATCARFRRAGEEAERRRRKREAREEELRRGEALRLARDADRRQAAASQAAARLREAEKTEKQLKGEEARQRTQRNRHIRDHLATRKAERKRSGRAK